MAPRFKQFKTDPPAFEGSHSTVSKLFREVLASLSADRHMTLWFWRNELTHQEQNIIFEALIEQKEGSVSLDMWNSCSKTTLANALSAALRTCDWGLQEQMFSLFLRNNASPEPHVQRVWVQAYTSSQFLDKFQPPKNSSSTKSKRPAVIRAEAENLPQKKRKSSDAINPHTKRVLKRLKKPEAVLTEDDVIGELFLELQQEAYVELHTEVLYEMSQFGLKALTPGPLDVSVPEGEKAELSTNRSNAVANVSVASYNGHEEHQGNTAQQIHMDQVPGLLGIQICPKRLISYKSDIDAPLSGYFSISRD